jgi:enolase
MVGLRTILVGAAVALGPPLLQYVGGVDWSSVLPAPWGTVAAGVIMVAMRFITSTPVGQPK